VNRILRAAEALGVRPPRNVRSKLAKLAAVVIALTGLVYPAVSNAATLSTASVALSDPQPSATASYNFTASGFTTATTIKCIKELYTVNADGTGGTPTGMTNAATALNASSTLITPASWTDATTTAGRVVYHRTAGETPGSGSRTFNIDTIHNSNSATSTGYWLTFSTWDGDSASGDCTGSIVDSVTVGFFITNGSTLSLTINGTLSFSVNGLTTADTCYGAQNSTQNSTATTIPFGTITTASTNVVCQRLNAATNATNGYTIYLRYDHKPQNALSQTIGDWTGTNAAPTTPFTATNTGPDGQGTYGYTTNDATLGTGTANRFTNGGPNWARGTTSNAEVGYESTGVSSTDYVVTHQVKISNTTMPGTYTNTIIYTCTPIY
jgi:hypothetical protein